jgi:putative ABC transport system permease protein
MTKINPALVLKGTFIMTPGGRKLRNSLLAFQYTTTVALIIVVVFIVQQTRYLQNFNPGYEKENIICIRNTSGIVKHYNSIENKLKQNSGVLDVCWSGNLPGEVGMGWGRDINGKHINITVWPVSKDFPRFFGIQTIKGRDFSATDSTDINNFIVNEAAVRTYGSDIFDVGKLIPAFDTTGSIIGICKDINFNSLYNSITPMALWIPTDQRNQVTYVKLKPGNQPVVIEEIRKSILQLSEEKNVEWFFLNDQLNALYSGERNLGRLLSIFAIIAVIISALGVIGLVILNARFQVKQTGIRKLLGASFLDLILSSNKNISFIMLLSSIISIPIAWYFVHKWLQQYPYQVSMNPLVFVLVPLIVMLILSLLISILSIRTARRNPVESLRYE